VNQLDSVIGRDSIETPKYQAIKQESLYTDPKLFEMIRQDLDDINKLKQSAFYDTEKFTYRLPQTESILSSIKNIDRENYQYMSSMPIKESFYHEDPTLKEHKSNRSTFDLNTKTAHNLQNQISPVKELLKMNKRDQKDNSNSSRSVFTVETYEDGRRF
jgi:hypothetical protein